MKLRLKFSLVTYLLYHLTYTTLVVRREILSFWCYHPVLKIPPTLVPSGVHYLDLFHPPQKYWYEDNLVLMLELASGHFSIGTFEVDR